MVRKLTGHGHEVTDLTFFGNESETSHVISASSDSTVRVWSINTGEQRGIFFCNTSAMCVEVVEDKKLAIGDSMGQFYVLELKGNL